MLHWWLNYGPKLAKDGPALFEECYPQGGALTYGEEGIARFVPQMEMAFVVLCPGFFERTLDAFYDVLADLKRCARTFLNLQQPAADDRYFYAGKPKLIFDPIRSCNVRNPYTKTWPSTWEFNNKADESIGVEGTTNQTTLSLSTLMSCGFLAPDIPQKYLKARYDYIWESVDVLLDWGVSRISDRRVTGWRYTPESHNGTALLPTVFVFDTLCKLRQNILELIPVFSPEDPFRGRLEKDLQTVEQTLTETASLPGSSAAGSVMPPAPSAGLPVRNIPPPTPLMSLNPCISTSRSMGKSQDHPGLAVRQVPGRKAAGGHRWRYCPGKRCAQLPALPHLRAVLLPDVPVGLFAAFGENMQRIPCSKKSFVI